MKKQLISFALVLAALTVFGQRFVPQESHSDCRGAFQVVDTVVYAQSASKGYGKVMEIRADKGSAQSIEKEHYTIWYKIQVPHTADFAFSLKADDRNDDHDFMLFVVDSTDRYCDQLSEGLLKPIRANIARNDASIGSETGLKLDAENAFQSEGVGNTFSKAIHVQKGQVILLLVDNVYGGKSGHTLTIHWRNNVKEKVESAFQYKITIKDKETNNLIEADLIVSIRKKTGFDTLSFSQVSHLVLEGDSLDRINVRASAQGYLADIEDVRLSRRNRVPHAEIFLQPVVVGKVIEIEDLFFMPGTDRIRSESKRTLRELLRIMKQNPTLKIDIQGHVNQPLNRVKRKHEDEYQELSERRAMAVYQYLVKRGIDKERLSYTGFGYKKMVFPYAKSEHEMQKNRRVEIEVVAL